MDPLIWCKAIHVYLCMETANTYRAIILGTTLLFGGCLLWLLISLNENDSIQKRLDQHRLKLEALTAEKLLADKALKKNEKRIRALEWDTARTKEILASRREEVQALKSNGKILSASLHSAKSEIASALQKNDDLRANAAMLTDSIRELQFITEHQQDSISVLQRHILALEQERDGALIRSIHQPLIFTQMKNGRLTSKARRVNELIAEMQLPSQLVNLEFRLEGSDGKILTTTQGLTVRERSQPPSLLATLDNVTIPPLNRKTMEIIYRPTSKLKAGNYALRILDRGESIGTLRLKLE